MLAFQLQEVELIWSNLIEPEAKYGYFIYQLTVPNSKDENAVLLDTPSDHVIPDKIDFHKAVEIGLPLVQNLTRWGLASTSHHKDH